MKLNDFLYPSFEIKAMDDESGTFEGFASTFGNVDLGGDIVDKGAFSKTLKENKMIPILADHDPSKQIGWNLEAEEVDKGLMVKGRLDVENNRIAKERFSLMKQGIEIGAKPGLSIGFMTIKAEPDDENPRIRRLKELKLMEYSFVTFPMNTEAAAVAAKQWMHKHLHGGDIDKNVTDFVAGLKEYGYTENQINSTLARAVEPQSNPDDLAQLFKEGLKSLKQN